MDLGCGDGYLATLLPGRDYVGVDLDRSKNPTAIAHDLSKAPYPFLDREFDSVICSEVLEHLWEPELALREIHRVLKVGGTLVATVPNFNSMDGFLDCHAHLVYDRTNTFSVEHIRQYTPPSLKRLLEGCGFSVVRHVGNSPHMSAFFAKARNVLGQRLADADQVLGEMFPDICPGFLMVAVKK